MFPFVKTKTGFTAVVEGTPYTVPETHENYSKLYQAVIASDATVFKNLYSVVSRLQKAVEKTGVKGVEVTDTGVYYNGKELHGNLIKRMLDFRQAGLPFDNYVKFLENLMLNPSSSSVEELYDFLENEGLPITDDGCFLAYKTVGSDFYSIAAGNLTLVKGTTNSRGQIFNGVGEEIECVRNEVDDNRGNQCSKGLHVGGLRYSGPNGSYSSPGCKVVYVKVNPKDAVSVPKDHNAEKLRVCAYKVLEEYKFALNESPLYTVKGNEVQTYQSSLEDDDEDFDEDFEDEFDDIEDEEDDDLGENYANDNLVRRTHTSASKVESSDYVEFLYEGKTRTLYVDVVDSEHVKGYLVTNDNDLWSSLDETNEYRCFSKSKISNVYKLS